MKKDTIPTITLQYSTAIFLVLSIFAVVIHAWKLKIGVPFYYSWDSVFSSVFIKSVMDTGWFLTNPFIGSPGGYNLADYPMAETVNFMLIKALALYVHHYAVVFNIFYILTFPMIACTALYTFKRLGLAYPFALAASLLFALQPYHFWSGVAGHLFLTAYFLIPLAILMVVSIEKEQTYWQWGFYGLLCILLGSAGIYYAVFTMFFLLVAGLITSVHSKNKMPFWRAILLSGLISVTLLANIIPSIEYHHKYGENTVVAERTPFEAELYGLKITQMLLPVTKDRINTLARLKEEYNSSAPLVNTENDSISLGLIGDVGFLLLLAIIILGAEVSKEIAIMSRLNLCTILFATIGGFASLFAYTVSPMIRCYSRIGIFIAFFSLFAFFYFLQKITEKYPVFKNRISLWLLVSLVLALGVFNQTGESFSAVESAQVVADFNNDENFVRLIEKNMPVGSMIFQLPYVPFPEYPPVGSMVDYESFRPYLHSHFLKWSYGSLKGRPVAIWQENQSVLPVQQMINNLSYMGYSGIYIDRNGYADRGAAIEKQIAAVLQVKPFVSENNNFSFFDMREFTQHLTADSLWQSHVLQVNNQTGISIDWNKGFYALETSNGLTWHWGNKQSVVNIVNYQNSPVRLKISFKLLTQDSTDSTLVLKSQLINQSFQVNNQGTVFSDVLTVPSGVTSLLFVSNAAQVVAPGDTRKLYFRIQDFNWDIVS